MDTIGVAVLLWLAAGIRIWRSAQKPHAAGLRALAIALVAIAIAATVNIQVVATWVDTTSRWANIGDLVKQITIVVAACGNQVMLLHLQADSSGDTAGVYRDEPARRIRGHWAVAAGVSALSMMLFLIGGRYREVGTEFARIYAVAIRFTGSRHCVRGGSSVFRCAPLSETGRTFRPWTWHSLAGGRLRRRGDLLCCANSVPSRSPYGNCSAQLRL